MSNKSLQKRMHKLPKPPPPPRQMAEIEQEYGKLVSQAGQAQYQIFVYTEDLQRINDAMRNLNYEAAARKNLDAQEASKPEPQPEQQEMSV